ncbi:hypothetical protein [Methylovorus glucosotrophus]|nr:hypothetical protein [Methylovorus glucosotrophus]
MNLYVVVEGVVETIVYPDWISIVNEDLKKVSYLDEVVDNNYILFSAGGYPNVFNVIDSAVEDISESALFDRLVVAMDAESFSYNERYDEIYNHLLQKKVKVDFKIIIQNPCFEAWALGNSGIAPRNPSDEKLKKYKRIFDILRKDPETIPDLPEEQLNKAQFSYEYLKLAIRDKGQHLHYSKNSPKLVCHPKYFSSLKERMEKKNHIRSFNDFITAFI